MFKGLGLSPGIAIGKAYVVNRRKLGHDAYLQNDAIQSEVRHLEAAMHSVKADLQRLLAAAGDKLASEQVDIFSAHMMILDDPSLKTQIITKITAEKKNCAWAVREVFAELVTTFLQMADEYFRERAADVKDIGARLLAALVGAAEHDDFVDGCIIVTEELTPSATLELFEKNITGIATEKGGQTGHAAILARTLGIPMVSKLTGLLAQVRYDTEIILDGNKGLLIPQPTATDIADYRQQQQVTLRQQSQHYLPQAITRDGRKVKIAANISRSEDVPAALAAGAAGVGLFRTEFIYMNKPAPPTEDEQYAIYKQVLCACCDQSVVIRTLDAGGDKPLSYLAQPRQDNPFLGLRGIRLSLAEQRLFRTQISALLRAAVYGQLKVLLPMVTNVAEIIQARQIILEIYQGLTAKGVACRLPREIGVMIEVPAAALIAESLIKEADFFSIGTNDLTQYTLAVDRGNSTVADLYDPYHPAVLKLIKCAADAARAADKWTGLCGELAGDVQALPALLGLGIDELSMSPVFIPLIHGKVGQVMVSEIAQKLPAILSCHDGREVLECLAK